MDIKEIEKMVYAIKNSDETASVKSEIEKLSDKYAEDHEFVKHLHDKNYCSAAMRLYDRAKECSRETQEKVLSDIDTIQKYINIENRISDIKTLLTDVKRHFDGDIVIGVDPRNMITCDVSDDDFYDAWDEIDSVLYDVVKKNGLAHKIVNGDYAIKDSYSDEAIGSFIIQDPNSYLYIVPLKALKENFEVYNQNRNVSHIIRDFHGDITLKIDSKNPSDDIKLRVIGTGNVNFESFFIIKW